MTGQDTSEEVQLAAVADVAIPGSFDAFYRSEFSRLVNIVYAHSGSQLAAEDLAQDAMIAADRQWKITLDRYWHLYDDDLEGLADAMDARYRAAQVRPKTESSQFFHIQRRGAKKST